MDGLHHQVTAPPPSSPDGGLQGYATRSSPSPIKHIEDFEACLLPVPNPRLLASTFPTVALTTNPQRPAFDFRFNRLPSGFCAYSVLHRPPIHSINVCSHCRVATDTLRELKRKPSQRTATHGTPASVIDSTSRDLASTSVCTRHVNPSFLQHASIPSYHQHPLHFFRKSPNITCLLASSARQPSLLSRRSPTVSAISRESPPSATNTDHL